MPSIEKPSQQQVATRKRQHSRSKADAPAGSLTVQKLLWNQMKSITKNFNLLLLRKSMKVRCIRTGISRHSCVTLWGDNRSSRLPYRSNAMVPNPLQIHTRTHNQKCFNTSWLSVRPSSLQGQNFAANPMIVKETQWKNQLILNLKCIRLNSTVLSKAAWFESSYVHVIFCYDHSPICNCRRSTLTWNGPKIAESTL